MKRLASKDLKTWYQSKNRKPLVLRGARQVGKSTLVHHFAKNHKLSIFEINLEKIQIKSLTTENISVQNLIDEIELILNRKIKKNDLIFFDEIQKQPEILKFLRYFYEERKDLAVISAGSLLEFVLEKNAIEMPVGRIQYYHLGPMSFQEYLMARDQNILIEQIEKSKFQINSALHEKLTEFYREYLYIGGMPEAIKVFIQTKNFIDVRAVHRSIIDTYRDDFSKYATRAQVKCIQEIFDKLPDFIGRKVKYSEFSIDLAAREVKKALELLRLSRVIQFCIHSNCSGVPLISQKDDTVFKIYFLDVGLLNSLFDMSWLQIKNSDTLIEGMMAEQFSAQHISYRHGGHQTPSLFYWLRDKKNENAEVDFIIEIDQTIYPIEIKAGQSGRLKSLIQFMYEKKQKQAFRFDLKFRSKNSENVEFKLSESGNPQTIKFNLINHHIALIGFVLKSQI